MSDDRPPIFTIGYGNFGIDVVFERLERYAIEYLVDVRSRPYSRRWPEFAKEALAAIARKRGIGYVFMGDTVGGMPSDETCYVDGVVDYRVVEQRAWYREGIDRLRAAREQGRRVALMCAEIDPERCHRSKLIGCTLERAGIPVEHIDRDGSLVAQARVMDRITGGQQPLFGDGSGPAGAEVS